MQQIEMLQADMIIIGSGQGGVALATSYAQEGKRVVLFERAQLGGTCVNYGCLPSKAFLASAHAAARARYAERLGVYAHINVDLPAVMDRARHTIDESQAGVRKGLIDAGVHLIESTGSFKEHDVVQGGGFEIQAPLIVINTGKSPSIPPIPGLDQVDHLTYQDLWGLPTLPRRMLVVGGGYVGVELAQGMARLGTETYVVERATRVVEQEEKEVSNILTEALWTDGVRIFLETEISAVSGTNGAIMAELSNGETLIVDTILIATGRKPNTAALHAERAGVDLDERGHVQVNEHFATTAPGVYAIGDVTGEPAFTHVSWEDYRRLTAILAGEDRSRLDRVLGYVFFTEPQIGRAGLTLEQAQAQGFNARAATIPLTQAARASLTDESLGFYRMVVDSDSDKILGATLAGPQAGELIHVFMALMGAGATWQTLERAMYVHPTYGEALPVLARQFRAQ